MPDEAIHSQRPADSPEAKAVRPTLDHPRYRYGRLTREQKAQLYELLDNDGSGGELIAWLCCAVYHNSIPQMALMLGMNDNRFKELLRSAFSKVKLNDSKNQHEQELRKLYFGR